MNCCTWFPEKFRGDNTQKACCQHDYDVTHYYSLITPVKNFWNNLEKAGVHWQWRLMIVIGATLGVVVRYPYFMYKVCKNTSSTKSCVRSLVLRVKFLWKKYNPFDISEVVERMVLKFDDIEQKLDGLKKSLEQEISFYKEKAEFQKALLDQIGDSLPDTVWCKDLDGRYIYANNALKAGFLFDGNPVGKTDAELCYKAKLLYGEDNYTFNDQGINSDKIVLQEGKPIKFLESGKIRGKMVYLEVYKNVVKDPISGNIIGICGTGRDLTEYVEAVKLFEKYCGTKCDEAIVINAFKKYDFKEVD